MVLLSSELFLVKDFYFEMPFVGVESLFKLSLRLKLSFVLVFPICQCLNLEYGIK